MNMLKKKLNKKGFTLAELLIVVAIIAVLVAISIPIFTSQLEKSREATDLANLRAAYAECSAEALTADTATYTAVAQKVEMKQTKAGWVTANPEVAGIKFDDTNHPFVTGTDVYVTVFCDGSTAPTFSTTAPTATTTQKLYTTTQNGGGAGQGQ